MNRRISRCFTKCHSEFMCADTFFDSSQTNVQTSRLRLHSKRFCFFSVFWRTVSFLKEHTLRQTNSQIIIKKKKHPRKLNYLRNCVQINIFNYIKTKKTIIKVWRRKKKKDEASMLPGFGQWNVRLFIKKVTWLNYIYHLFSNSEVGKDTQ